MYFLSIEAKYLGLPVNHQYQRLAVDSGLHLAAAGSVEVSEGRLEHFDQYCHLNFEAVRQAALAVLRPA